MLVKAKLSTPDTRKSDRFSKHFIRLHYIRNRTNRHLYRITQTISLHQTNCVYLLFCKKWNTQYIGETKHSIKTRLLQHLGNIRHNRESNTRLVQHFQLHNIENVRITGIERNNTWTDNDRKKKEKLWIYTLGTKEPNGLNMKY